MRYSRLRTQKQLRSAYLVQLRDKFVTAIQDIYKRTIQENIDSLAEQNANLTGGSPTFEYNGKQYAASWYEQKPGTDTVLIDPQLLPKISAFLNQIDFSEAIQESRIRGYFDNIFMFSLNIMDLYELIPVKFHGLINDVDQEIYNIGPKATAQKIEQFKKSNRSGLIEFTKLTLEDLLV